MVELEKSKSGYYTLKYNNKYIHSKYDPIGESKRFVEANKHLIKENIVVIGLGLGYHIEEMLRISEGKSKIYVFEGSEDVIAYCETINLKLFNNKNIEIIGPKDKDFDKKLAEKINMVEDIMIYTPSLQSLEEINEELYVMIKDYKLSRYSIYKNEELLEINYKQNLKQDYKNIRILIEIFKNNSKSYIITSAGPSLDNEMKILKENREEFIIVCVGSALRTLMNNEIVPDIIVIIDGQEIVKDQLRDYETINVPLCFLSTASRWAVGNYKGPKYMFYNSIGEDEIIIETGKTVAMAAINIAIKCGAREIIFLGQDLAYVDNKGHTETFEKIYGVKDFLVCDDRRKKVKGVDGKNKDTTTAYLYFKNKIEKTILNNNNTNFINCSKGAYIEGAEHMEFVQYIKNKL